MGGDQRLIQKNQQWDIAGEDELKEEEIEKAKKERDKLMARILKSKDK